MILKCMLENLKDYIIILASNSPRRKELLSGFGLDFTVRTMSDTDESFPEDLDVQLVAGFIAEKKARAFETSIPENALLITADTVVCLGNKIFGKPANREDAYNMLRALSGKTHKVYTGVCIRYATENCPVATEMKKFTSETEVCFSELTDEEINYYLDNYKPFDKAGAYGIQEWIGFAGVERISGSFFNVMGLPVHKLYEELKNIPPFLNPENLKTQAPGNCQDI